MPLIGGMMADKFGYGKMVTSGIIIMFVGYKNSVKIASIV